MIFTITFYPEMLSSLVERIREVVADHNDLESLSYFSNQVRGILQKKIEILEEEKLIGTIYRSIKKKSFYVSNKKIDIEKLGSVNRFTMIFYVDMQAYDKEDKNDAEISGTADKQDEWVRLLNVDYCAGRNDTFEDYIDEWNWDSHSEPACCTGYIYLYLYFSSKQVLPPPEETFYLISEDGTVEKNEKGKPINTEDLVDYFIYKPVPEPEPEPTPVPEPVEA